MGNNSKNNLIYENGNKDRVKKAVKTSVITFMLIIGISLLFLVNCNSNGCTVDGYKLLNVFIIGIAAIGLVYCYFGLKDFNKPVPVHHSEKDKDLIHLEKVLLSDQDNNPCKEDKEK